MADETHVPRRTAREVNDEIRYAMWSVFRVDRSVLHSQPGATDDELADGVDGVLTVHENHGVVVRGWYDVAGLRADADLMLWTHGPTSDSLQSTYHGLLRTPFGRALVPVWSQMGLHRPAEFNKSHVPEFMVSDRSYDYLCVYPFVRSFQWYLLPDDERRELLMEHGMMGRGYPDVRANTVPAFALGDYEWILAFEADALDRIVDLMRDLRASRARLHVREEIPFYTGRRRALVDFIGDVR
ncbi:MAG: hydrogen peroxide-dependent heme synthase [Actinomycetes bacterium]